jgi:ubiquinone/menaquinone biosynthesis C-methylase UbiE
LQQYRSRIRHLYDGPAGAVLVMASVVSLHEPLVGRMFRRRKFDVADCRNILDVGSGAGQILGHLLKRTHSETRLVAFDLSHGMLRRARSRLHSARPSYVAGDLTQLPFADNSFDCITCGWVIEHLPDPRPGLRELSRVLQPGGRLLLLATEDTLQGMVVSQTWKCRTYNRRELRSACEEVGLPWRAQLWFTPIHRFFKVGGILVEARKPLLTES